MQQASKETIGWFAGRIPDDWFTAAPEVTYDRDEILVVGALAEPTAAKGEDDDTRSAARRSRIEAFREETRLTYLHELGHYLGWGEDELAARGLD